MAMFIEHTPAITDDDLQTLLARARRWSRAGNARQKAALAELLPAVQELIDARRSLRRDLIDAGRDMPSVALH